MIGGEHYLPTPLEVSDSLGTLLSEAIGHVEFFATGRDALATLLTSLPVQHIHTPDLICLSVHSACGAARKKTINYRINSHFLHDRNAEALWTTSAAVLVMHYFGIINDGLMIRASAAGHLVISDVTHILFDRKGLQLVARHSDYLVASLRKSGPFPDGGFASSMRHKPPLANRGLREDFFARRCSGLLSRGFSCARDFDNDENFELLRNAENVLNNSTPADYSCSFLSRRIAHTIAVSKSADIIRRNSAVLRAGLSVRYEVPQAETVSPYFPCLFTTRKERDNVRTALAMQRIFCPVHWPTEHLPSPSLLAERGLSIPCDTRYDENDMHSVIATIETCIAQ